ncbi:MAG: ABC transporter permease [Staphylothermus sp.]|nr:ABC transporter permease [Staphylothermus sp.]
MESICIKIYAILWLHLTRLHRYKYGFLNMIVTDMIWYLLFMLGTLTFIPSEDFKTMAVITFWGVALWSSMNNTVWIVGNWIRFLLEIGIVEEHIVRNTNPMTLIAGRIITATIVTIVAIPVVGIIYYELTGINIFKIFNPFYLLFSFVLIMLYALFYSLILSSIGLRLRIPGIMLDVLNIVVYIIGGIGVPLTKMPAQMRIIAFLIPYTYAAELERFGATGLTPLLGLSKTIVFGTLYLIVLLMISILIIRYSTNYIRKYGVKAIGAM